jgi:hypothetical protein
MILHYNPKMKSKTIAVIALATLMLVGCGTLKQGAAFIQNGHGSAVPASGMSKSNQLLKEANRLAEQVKQGQLSRLQAADELNILRLRLVGANRVDDSTFATYRFLVLKREAGTMSQEESHSRMEMKLRDWQRRWPALSKRPADPAFTNFLMQLYSMPALK